MNKCSFRLLLEFRLEINKILLNESIYLREDLEVKSRISSKIVFLGKDSFGQLSVYFLKGIYGNVNFKCISLVHLLMGGFL